MANAIVPPAGLGPLATNASQIITDRIAPPARIPAPLTDSAMMASRATGNATAARVGWERPVLSVPLVLAHPGPVIVA